MVVAWSCVCMCGIERLVCGCGRYGSQVVDVCMKSRKENAQSSLHPFKYLCSPSDGARRATCSRRRFLTHPSVIASSVMRRASARGGFLMRGAAKIAGPSQRVSSAHRPTSVTTMVTRWSLDGPTAFVSSSGKISSTCRRRVFSNNVSNCPACSDFASSPSPPSPSSRRSSPAPARGPPTPANPSPSTVKALVQTRTPPRRP